MLQRTVVESELYSVRHVVKLLHAMQCYARLVLENDTVLFTIHWSW